jgi:NAD(P)-dependent dehydrogenase (short-subunit alcohol dehydrogenase family)
MAWIRIAACVTMFVVLLHVSSTILPVIHQFSDPVILLILAWSIGVIVTRKMILPLLPEQDNTGRAVLVTGCDHGVGYATAKHLAGLGFHVFAGCLSAESKGAKKLRQEAGAKGQMIILQMDVTREEEIINAKSLIQDMIDHQRHGIKELFAVVNNAGIVSIGPAEAVNKQQYEKIWAVNVMGPVLVCLEMLPLLRLSRGRVITVSSMDARLAVKNMVPYSMTKAAVSKFMEGLHQEVERFGIKCITIEPWVITGCRHVLNKVLEEMHDNFEKSSEELRNAYGIEYVNRIEKLIDFPVNNPLNSTRQMVVADIVNAITSIEPEPVYRVVRTEMAWFFSLQCDYLPWTIVYKVREFTNRIREYFAGLF